MVAIAPTLTLCAKMFFFVVVVRVSTHAAELSITSLVANHNKQEQQVLQTPLAQSVLASIQFHSQVEQVCLPHQLETLL